MMNELDAVMSCAEIVQLLWDYLDSELDAERAAVVRRHLDHCAHCRDHFTFEGAFLRAIDAVIDEPLDTAALRIRIITALRAAGPHL
jgi:anti-sigma factor (TIGR02949 family)